MTRGSWRSIGNIKLLYDIGTSKAHEFRSVVTALDSGKIEGITTEMFAETFEDGDIISMPLQKDKCASFRQAVMI